jgi:malate/lactate dehydrogenase
MKIAIIGAAGHVGSSAAFNIAINQICDELVMIDDFSADKLSQYVYDLESTVTGLDTHVYPGHLDDLRDSDIVIIAAGSANVVASRLEVLKPNLSIMKSFADRIKKLCPRAIVITATNPVCPLNYGMFLLTGFNRRRLIGYSYNDSIRFRMFTAQALGIPSSRVDAAVMGEHGNSQVLVFSSMKIDGKPYKVKSDTREEIRKQIANLPPVMEGLRIKTGRTSAWTTSMGLTRLCRAISQDTRETIPCSVVLEGEYGYRKMGMSVPAVIGQDGVIEIQQWNLDAEEQEGLKRSADTLAPAMRFAEEFATANK